MQAQKAQEVLASAQCAAPNGRWKQMEGRVSTYYRLGQQRRLVRGKWLWRYLETQLRDYFGSSPVHWPTSDAMLSSMLATLDGAGPWSAAYHQRISLLLT